MAERAAQRRHGQEDQEARRAEPPRHRRPEGQQPDRVQDEVRPAAVQQRVGDQRPGLGGAAPHQLPREAEALHQVGVAGIRGQPLRQGRDRVDPEQRREAGREEGQFVNESVLPHPPRAQGVQSRQRQDHGDDHEGHVEDRLAILRVQGWFHGGRSLCPDASARRTIRGALSREPQHCPGESLAQVESGAKKGESPKTLPVTRRCASKRRAGLATPLHLALSQFTRSTQEPRSTAKDAGGPCSPSRPDATSTPR